MNKANKKSEGYIYLIHLLAAKVYKEYRDCLLFNPEPEHFFESSINKMGYSKDKSLIEDTWKVFIDCLSVGVK
jgi:hypothetical protein